MAEFSGFILTNKGRELQAKAEAGEIFFLATMKLEIFQINNIPSTTSTP